MDRLDCLEITLKEQCGLQVGNLVKVSDVNAHLEFLTFLQCYARLPRIVYGIVETRNNLNLASQDPKLDTCPFSISNLNGYFILER